MAVSVDQMLSSANYGATAALAEPLILASAATGIVATIEQQHGDIDRIFGHAGIAPEMAGSPTLQLGLAPFCALFEHSARLTHNDNFGLWFGNKFEARDLGLWGYAAVSTPTVGAALQTLCELFPHHQQSSMLRLRTGPNGLLHLEYRIESAEIVACRQDAELSLGTFLNVLREGLGATWAPEEVHFEHPKPEGHREHRQAFNAPVFFSQPTNALIFRPEVMAMRMPASDPRLLAAMRLCLQRLSDRNDWRVTVTDRVRSAVKARLPDGFPALEDISFEIRLPLHAIERELRRDGINYKDLVEKTRQDLALMYIRQRQLQISEIALLLGYSELSAFSRAVRRWTGQSPRSLRAGMASELIR